MTVSISKDTKISDVLKVAADMGLRIRALPITKRGAINSSLRVAREFDTPYKLQNHDLMHLGLSPRTGLTDAEMYELTREYTEAEAASHNSQALPA